MTTTAIGKRGEDLTRQWLLHNNFTIVERNWKTRWCEIDIIAEKQGIIYFVEVKFRKNSSFGDGFDYITAKKQQQMQFAAEFWLKQHNYGGECQLAAASIDGTTDAVEFLADL